MKKSSKNMILYKGRYIRRMVINGHPYGYVICWHGGSREREVWHGSLSELLARIDNTVAFFGKWAYLI